MKFSGQIADWLVEMGYTHCFMVAGGGSMHLLDACRKKFVCVPVVHEQVAGIAVEHFNECSMGKKAFALVTTGPGLTNIVTPMAACYAERRELLVIAGQVNVRDQCAGLRQSGIQEVDGIALTKSITVRNACLKQPIGREAFRALVEQDSHPGPVLVEVCLEVQGAVIEPTPDPVQAIREAKRPVILIGGLVTRRTARHCLAPLEKLGVPVLTTTSAIDRIPSTSYIHFGRAGTWGGQRSANLILAQADVVLVIGAQLDVQQTGFNWDGWANGKIFQVFPDEAELSKGRLKVIGINEEPDIFLVKFLGPATWKDDGWMDYCLDVASLPPEPNTHRTDFICPYNLLRNLSLASKPDDVIALSSAGQTFTGGLNSVAVAREQTVTVSPAFASMGWGLPAAIGAAFATGKRVILAEGDGGFAMNLQDLATVRLHKLNIKIFLFVNDGYGSIRSTQKKYFGAQYLGCDQATGLGAPDWLELFGAYGLPARELDTVEPDRLAEIMEVEGPEAFVVRVDPDQTNYPVVASGMDASGRMSARPNWDMLPPLAPDVLARVTKYL